ncbi:MAG TPA: M20 family metallopeptidase [Acidimicrobiales bacterium]|nr:M20 family metallopeptidase [Acidimicrobiales bacterium]
MATLLEEAQALQDRTIALRRALHADPELALELPRTQERVVDELADLPIALTPGNGCTSLVGVLEGDRPGPTVLLRGDMDALPMREDTGLEFSSRTTDAMHACGHDAHTAMLGSAARLLCDRRGELAGRVVFMFQPGEEGAFGAKVMLDNGMFDVAGRPDAAFALHQSPSMPSGMIAVKPGATMAATNTFTIRVVGKGGHASMPHLAVDPIPAACELVVAMQSYVTRRVDAFDPAVVTVAKIRAGTTTNVVPEDALLMGTIRTVSTKTRAMVVQGIEDLAKGIASAHGCEAQVEMTEGYPVTVNDETMAGYIRDVATGVAAPGLVRWLPAPVMGAEDFSYVLNEVPGAMAFLGTMPAGHAGFVAPNHSNRMVLNEDAMAVGVAVYAAAALQFGSATDAE